MVSVATASANGRNGRQCMSEASGGSGPLTYDKRVKHADRAIWQFPLQGTPADIPALAPHGPSEVCAQHGEHGQADDLEGQARNHDVDARLQQGIRARGIGQGAPDSLQDERKDVAADEDDGVGARFEPSEGFSVNEDDAREGKVDCGGEEARCDCKNDNVPSIR